MKAWPEAWVTVRELKLGCHNPDMGVSRDQAPHTRTPEQDPQLIKAALYVYIYIYILYMVSETLLRVVESLRYYWTPKYVEEWPKTIEHMQKRPLVYIYMVQR